MRPRPHSNSIWLSLYWVWHLMICVTLGLFFFIFWCWKNWANTYFLKLQRRLANQGMLLRVQIVLNFFYYSGFFSGLMIYLISNNQTHRGIYYISETGGCKRFLNKKKRIQAHHSVFSQFPIYISWFQEQFLTFYFDN